MSPDDPHAALRDIADHLPDLKDEVKGLRDEVQGSRRKIRWLVAGCALIALVALGAVSWTAYQQTVITALVDQNHDTTLANARNAHDLCVKLSHSRKVIVGVWRQVQFRPGADSGALLAQVLAAEPLGHCPKAPPAGS